MPATESTIRYAEASDAAAIADLKQAAWPDEPPPDPAYYAHVIQKPGHATQLAAVGDRALGFIDGFLTLAADGTRRWEVDLLAVHPAARQRGLGRSLVAACTTAGLAMGAAYARALIHVENTASQRTFARCGYRQEDRHCRLFVMSDGTDDGSPAPPDAHLIPVTTLNYRGLWVEGNRSAAALGAARAIRARHGWDVVGTVIPLANADALSAAAAVGYATVGDYAWWRFDGPAGA